MTPRQTIEGIVVAMSVAAIQESSAGGSVFEKAWYVGRHVRSCSYGALGNVFGRKVVAINAPMSPRRESAWVDGIVLMMVRAVTSVQASYRGAGYSRCRWWGTQWYTQHLSSSSMA